MNRKMSLLAAVAASVTGSMAFAVVDGTVTGGEYAATLALQNTPTGFGDNFSELNAAYANYTPGAALGLALTGNIEANGNSIVLFLDSKASGGILTSAGGGFGNVGPQQGFRTDDWNGATLAPNFNPDYSLELSNDGAGYYFNVIDMALTPGDPDKDVYMGQFNPATGPYIASPYTRTTGPAGTISHHLDNSNTAGVNSYDFGTPPGPLGDPTTATTGFEFEFDSTFLGYTPGHAVRAMAFITNGGGDYLSNQFLPGLNGATNLGNPGGDGGDSIFDSRVIGGDKFYLTVFSPTTSTSGGDWSAATWTGGFTPNGIEHAAHLTGTSASSMDVSTLVTVGYLDLDNPAGWTLNAAGGSIGLDGGNGSAVVFATQGNHTITAPVAVVTTTRVNTGANSISMTGGLSMAAGMRITKAGSGTLMISGAQTNGAASSIAVDAGALSVYADLGDGLTGADRPDVFVSRDGASATTDFNTTQHLDQLHVNNTGVATLAQSGGVDVIVANSFTADPTGKLDITDNKIIVHGGDLGTWDGTKYTGLTGEIQRGRNPDTGTWDGAGGITTSMTDATTGVLTSLAISSGAELRGLGPTDTDVFLGETINGDSVIAMYTWGGDADLNGELNGDDYFYLDSYVLQNGTVFGWHQGDFDYNGELNGDDYFIIDSNILQAQGSGIIWPTGVGAGGLAAVPEPASLGVLAIGATGLLRRRRRMN